MSDLFHPDIPTKFIQRIFDVILKANQHRYQILTKRSDRLAKMSSQLSWQPNIWMGVTVESKEYVHRIDDLLTTGAAVKFLSLEPLLSALPALNLDGIDWVIVGGESGPGSRLIKKEWVEDICEQCCAKEIPFFFKQWGGTNKKKAGKILNGKIWNQMPEEEGLLV
jgi:protein gp37